MARNLFRIDDRPRFSPGNFLRRGKTKRLYYGPARGGADIFTGTNLNPDHFRFRWFYGAKISNDLFHPSNFLYFAISTKSRQLLPPLIFLGDALEEKEGTLKFFCFLSFSRNTERTKRFRTRTENKRGSSYLPWLHLCLVPCPSPWTHPRPSADGTGAETQSRIGSVKKYACCIQKSRAIPWSRETCIHMYSREIDGGRLSDRYRSDDQRTIVKSRQPYHLNWPR